MAVRRRLALGTLLLLIGGAGCHHPDESYYPLRPGRRSVHRMWGKSQNASEPEVNLDGLTFTATALPPRDLDGRQVIPEMIDLNGHLAFAYLVSRPGGVYQVANQKLDEKTITTFTEPSCVLPFPLIKSRSCDVSLFETAAGVEFPITGNAKIEALDEVVTVPAGTYRHCVKVTSEMSGSAYVERVRATLDVHTIEWLAPDVGLVKSIYWLTSTPRWVGWASRTTELTAFK